MIQLGEFLGRLLESLLKNWFGQFVFKPLAESALMLLRLTAATPARDTSIQENFFYWV